MMICTCLEELKNLRLKHLLISEDGYIGGFQVEKLKVLHCYFYPVVPSLIIYLGDQASMLLHI